MHLKFSALLLGILWSPLQHAVSPWPSMSFGGASGTGGGCLSGGLLFGGRLLSFPFEGFGRVQLVQQWLTCRVQMRVWVEGQGLIEGCPLLRERGRWNETESYSIKTDSKTANSATAVHYGLVNVFNLLCGLKLYSEQSLYVHTVYMYILVLVVIDNVLKCFCFWLLVLSVRK